MGLGVGTTGTAPSAAPLISHIAFLLQPCHPHRHPSQELTGTASLTVFGYLCDPGVCYPFLSDMGSGQTQVMDAGMAWGGPGMHIHEQLKHTVLMTQL
jgi:hypothetical protein